MMQANTGVADCDSCEVRVSGEAVSRAPHHTFSFSLRSE